jgi:hypothetical protein
MTTTDPKPPTPVTTIGDDAILSVKQAAACTPFGVLTLRAALESRELDGRFIGGSTGWVTTWKALTDFARGKGQRLLVPDGVPDGVPDEAADVDEP